MTRHQRIAIVGGGPGGLMLARLLQRQGLRPTIFEGDDNDRDRPQGGSLDLHGDTGLRAMRLAGLESEFAASARPEDQGDRLYDQDGTLLFDRDGADDDRPEIDRTALRRILLDSLEPATVRWASRVTAVVPGNDGTHDLVVNGRRETWDVVIGADGAWSRVRPALTDAAPIYEGVTLVEFGFDALRHPLVDRLVGSGKMFAPGDNRLLIAQRNGHGHIRVYAGLRIAEAAATEWAARDAEAVRSRLRPVFEGWASSLTYLFERGDFLAVRPLYALPVGLRWPGRPGMTLLGDAAHLMSPFSGEGVNLALADAADLAVALVGGAGWRAVEDYEALMADRASPAAAGAAEGLDTAFSADGVGAVLDHYRERTGA